MNDELFIAKPSKAQYEWQDMEIGMFFHWFPDVKESIGQPWDIEQQKIAAASMDCPNFNPEQWVQSAVDLGAKYIVFVAKHNMGICRWRSEYGGLNFKYSPYKNGQGDPLGELAQECKKRGIRLGVYLAGMSDTFGVACGGIARNSEEQKEYDKIYRGWLTEILSKYGDMVEVWFDGSIFIEVGDILKKYAPNAVIFQSKYANIRWVGQEEGYASDPVWSACSRFDAVSGVSTQAQGNPDGDTWAPYECDTTLRRDWLYNTHPTNELKSLDKLMETYYNSVGHGANLLINHAPHANGSIDEIELQRMKEFGDEIRRRFSNPVASTNGKGTVVELDLGKETPIDHVITMEEILYGQRIRSYVIEGLKDGKWVKLVSGISIGHKKIDYFESTKVSKIRFSVIKNVGEPIIRSISAFNVGNTPKLKEKTKYDEIKIGEYGTELFDLETNIANLSYEIETYTEAAGQYRISFRDTIEKSDENFIEIESAWVEMNGAKMEGYVKKSEDGRNEFDIFIPGGAKSIIFNAISKPRHSSIKGETVIYRMY